MYLTTGASSTSALSSSEPPCGAVGLLEVDLEVLHAAPMSFSRAPEASTSLWIAAGELVVLDDDRLDDEVGLEPDFLERLQVGRVGGRDEEPVAALVQRQDVPRLGDLEVDQVLLDLVEVEGREVEQRDAEGARREHRELVRRDPLAGEHLLDERDPGLLRLRLQRLGLVLGHQPVLRQRAREAADVARRGGVGGHGLERSEIGARAWECRSSPSTSNSCAVSATTCAPAPLFQPHKTYPADDACPSGLCKGAAGAPPTGGSRRTTLTPRSCVCRISIACPATLTRVPASGNLAELLDDEPVQRFRAVEGETGAELAVERAQRRHAVDDDAAVRRRAGRCPRRRAPAS